jgi:hypothetical protein
LEKLKVDSMEISRPWENIRDSKNEKSLGEGNPNSQLHQYAGGSFMGDYCFFFNTIYMMGEKPEEWKHNIVIPIYTKGGKQRVENYSLINVFYEI